MSRYAFLRHRDVESIPARGAIVVTYTKITGRCLKDGIAELRGADLVKRCRFVSINRCGDEQELEGLSGYVILAHCFRLGVQPHLLMRVGALTNVAELMAKGGRARPKAKREQEREPR